MNRIVGIGACVKDTLLQVPDYPIEDTKMRALSSREAGGGPVATGLVAAAKLGADAAYIGVLSTDSAGEFLLRDFEKYAVATHLIEQKSGYRSFTSVIWLGAKNASRTCVFDKGDLPPLTLSEAQKKALAEATLLMVDGNELDAAVEAAALVRQGGGRVLYDCGGLYPGVERLLALTDIMIPSAEFAMGHTGCDSIEAAAKKLFSTYHPAVVVVTDGKRGGLLYDGKKTVTYPIYPANVVDSNGSGDVFHGAFAAGVCRGFDFERCCHFASAVSAIKCMGVGARESVPDFSTVQNYMKENGYEL
ncbi:MAG: hypothetical protein E7644_04370 [Ruminococcaceae bacterium]|nr:hypothetical protein [Oscillospiraceae bacterium]